MNKGTEKNIKKIKNILSDDTSKDKTNKFDVLFLIDATGSMSSYIRAAKEESKNIAEELRKLYPEMMFKYGYIFYRDPIDVKTDIHEIIDLTDNVNSLPEQIGKIKATGGGDSPEDWVGAYKMANENISWRDGNKVIIHLCDAGAHGKLFTKSDKYPEEEAKLIQELEKCALKKLKFLDILLMMNVEILLKNAQKYIEVREALLKFLILFHLNSIRTTQFLKRILRRWEVK